MLYGILLGLIGSVLAMSVMPMSHNNLAIRPKAQPVSDQALGEWYVTYFLAPRSWQQAYQFKDWFQNLTIDSNTEVVVGKDIYREFGECVHSPFNLTLSENEDTYILDHSLGNVISGEVVIVSYDTLSNEYLIKWGCTRFSLTNPNYCEDSWLMVKTRKQKPPQYIINQVDAHLEMIFDIRIYDLLKMPQTFPPCILD